MNRSLKVAYLVTQFPSLSQTFVTNEMYWIRNYGIEINIFSLFTPNSEIIHTQARELLPYVNYSPFLSWKVLKAQLHFLRVSPIRYLKALGKIIHYTYHEPMLFLRALFLFPKSVYFVGKMKESGNEHLHVHFVTLASVCASAAVELLDITLSIHPHAVGLFKRNQEDVRRQLQDASQVTTISSFHQNYIANLCPAIAPEDVGIIYCGIDTDRFQPLLDHFDNKVVHILSVGRLVEKKGFEYLIDACALLAKGEVDFVCQIVGDGPLREALQTRIEDHGLQGLVTLLGPLEQASVLNLYQTSDIFVLPCVVAHDGNRDGLPVVLLEAMACELPVITTPTAGIVDAVSDGETGLFVQERDSQDLAKAIERLIVDETLRNRLGEQARQKILEDFQIQGNTAKLAAIFHQVKEQKQSFPINGVSSMS